MTVENGKKPDDDESSCEKSSTPPVEMGKTEETAENQVKMSKPKKNKSMFSGSVPMLIVLYLFLWTEPGWKFTTFQLVTFRDLLSSTYWSLHCLLYKSSRKVNHVVTHMQDFNFSAPLGTCPANPLLLHDTAGESVEWCQQGGIVMPDFNKMLSLLGQIFQQAGTDIAGALRYAANLVVGLLTYSFYHAIGTLFSFLIMLFIIGHLIKMLPTLIKGLSSFNKFNSSLNTEEISRLTKQSSSKMAGSQISSRDRKTKTNEQLLQQAGERSSLLSMLLMSLGSILNDGYDECQGCECEPGKSENKSVPNRKRSDVVKLADYKGGSEAKKELELVLDFLKGPQKFHDLGARLPRGILLYGPPGTGKTLFARALAGEANVKFIHKCASEFRSMFVGSGAQNIRNVFASARRLAPCILFIDEIDSISKRTSSSMHPYANQAINQILYEMDGFIKNESDVVVVGATNRLDNIDDALLRPGRFDKLIHVDLPDFNARKDILDYYIGRLKKVGNVNSSAIATRTDEYSGAELEHLVNEAALIAVSKGAEKVEHNHVEAAVQKLWKSREQVQKYDSKNYKPSSRNVIAHMYN